MTDASLETIEKQAAKLSLQDQIKLMEVLARQLRRKSIPAQQLDWAGLYGLGKGLWSNQDAQDYVNSLREDRE